MKTLQFNQYERLKLFVPPVYNSLLRSEQNFGAEVVTRHYTDVDLVLNQKRIDDSMIASIVQGWRTSSPSDTSKFSDEQLISSIKSRHLQSASEIQSWLNYIDAQAGNIIDEMKQNQPSEPSPSEPSPAEPAPTELVQS